MGSNLCCIAYCVVSTILRCGNTCQNRNLESSDICSDEGTVKPGFICRNGLCHYDGADGVCEPHENRTSPDCGVHAPEGFRDTWTQDSVDHSGRVALALHSFPGTPLTCQEHRRNTNAHLWPDPQHWLNGFSWVEVKLSRRVFPVAVLLVFGQARGQPQVDIFIKEYAYHKRLRVDCRHNPYVLPIRAVVDFSKPIKRIDRLRVRAQMWYGKSLGLQAVGVRYRQDPLDMLDRTCGGTAEATAHEQCLKRNVEQNCATACPRLPKVEHGTIKCVGLGVCKIQSCVPGQVHCFIAEHFFPNKFLVRCFHMQL